MKANLASGGLKDHPAQQNHELRKRRGGESCVLVRQVINDAP